MLIFKALQPNAKSFGTYMLYNIRTTSSLFFQEEFLRIMKKTLPGSSSCTYSKRKPEVDGVFWDFKVQGFVCSISDEMVTAVSICDGFKIQRLKCVGVSALQV